MAEMSAAEVKLAAQQHHRLLTFFLLAYRWISLVPAIWLFVSAAGPITPNITSIALLALAVSITMLVTITERFFSNYSVLKNPFLLGLDALFMAILLALSGASQSLYTFHALSPLLAGAFFFQIRGALSVTSAFTVLYLLTISIVRQLYPITIEVSLLFTQLAGAWLVTVLFGSLSPLLRQLSQIQDALVNAYKDLTRQDAELAATHHHLEVMHELTLSLQTSDSQSVQQRLLKAVAEDLCFSQAVIGLVNPILERLDGWQAYPPTENLESAEISLPLTIEDGLISQAALKQQVHWCPNGQALSADKALNSWLETENWLILPLIWQEHTVGILLVAVEEVGHVDSTDERWVVLTSLVSQAAVALGTIDRTRRLAIEQERNRIARDIHDTVAQSLFGIAFTLDACTKLLPDQAEMVQQELIELRAMADQVRKEVRQSILDIWPSELTHEKFKIDLQKYVTHSSPSYVFNVDFNIDNDFNKLSPTLRRSLYRVCQEALANAARHAGIDSARVYLYVESHEVHMSIRDKGQGFDTKLALGREYNREQFGLKGMCERIWALGGSCDIHSQIGQGTQVLVSVPLNNSRNGHG